MKVEARFKLVGRKEAQKSDKTGYWFIADVEPVDAYTGKIDVERGDDFKEQFPLFLDTTDANAKALRDLEVGSIFAAQLDICVGSYRDGQKNKSYPRHQVKVLAVKAAKVAA